MRATPLSPAGDSRSSAREFDQAIQVAFNFAGVLVFEGHGFFVIVFRWEIGRALPVSVKAVAAISAGKYVNWRERRKSLPETMIEAQRPQGQGPPPGLRLMHRLETELKKMGRPAAVVWQSFAIVFG